VEKAEKEAFARNVLRQRVPDRTFAAITLMMAAKDSMKKFYGELREKILAGNAPAM